MAEAKPRLSRTVTISFCGKGETISAVSAPRTQLTLSASPSSQNTSGVTPAARFWTLTLYDTKGHLVANSLQRYGFTSEEVIRGADGAFEVRMASRSRAGNWLPTGGIERYALILRLYDTPVGVATRTPRDAPMPSIATVGCP